VAKIMIIDDQINNARLVSIAVNLLGHESIEVFRGEQAVEAIGSEHPDLVLLDYMMPGMNGLETLQQIRERYGGFIPIYILTAAKDRYLQEKVIDSGATGYFSKPLDLDMLETVISQRVALVSK
jgi:CheY-like chemotaxis protein